MGKKAQNSGMDNPFKNIFDTQSKPTGIRLYVRDKADVKQRSYVKLCATEIGWMGFVKLYQDVDQDTGLLLPGVPVLEDVFLYDQEVSGGSVDSGDAANRGEALSETLHELAANEETADKIVQLRYFAHSHVNMGVTPSNVDTDMINDWGATGLEWFFSTILNKRGEYDCRLDMFQPFRASIPVEMVLLSNAGVEAEVMDEMELKVTMKSYSNSGGGYGTNPMGFRRSWRDLSTEGKVSSKIEDRILDTSEGTVNCPTVVFEDLDVKWANKDITKERIRREVVYGIVIHESVVGSEAAKDRWSMPGHLAWDYYRDYMNEPAHAELKKLADHRRDEKNKAKAGGASSITRPRSGQLELVESSRSIQRSQQKRTSDSTDQDQGEQHQTQTQDEAKKKPAERTTESKPKKQSKSNDDTKSKTERTSDKKDGKESLPEVDQEKLSVTQEEDASTTDDPETEKDLRDALAESGYAV